ncbi:MAG: hypothetical protein KGL18_07115, partial [Burkholderiales bacterium]|nr:hypothetical protein [Burkholderiales bacterium]
MILFSILICSYLCILQNQRQTRRCAPVPHGVTPMPLDSHWLASLCALLPPALMLASMPRRRAA